MASAQHIARNGVESCSAATRSRVRSRAQELLESLVDASRPDVTGVKQHDRVECHFHPLVLRCLCSLAGAVPREGLTAC